METLLTEAPAFAETRWISLSSIDIPPLARRHNPDRVASLADDMAVNGQLQEIVVVPKGERFEVAAGVGRTLAAKKLGWDKIRSLVRGELSEFDRLRITFAENEEREDVSPIYQAQLLEKMKISGNFKDQGEMAKKMGKSPGLISQYFSLLDLEPEVREKFNALNLTLRQLLELKRLPDADLQLQVGDECAKSDLSGKALKARVDQLAKPKAEHTEQSKAGNSQLPSARSALLPDLAWKGEEIAINRHYKPAKESVQDYVVWLTLALQAFAETKSLNAGGSRSKIEDRTSENIKKDPTVAQASSDIRSPNSDLLKPRLPQTPEEEKELQDIATKAGPQGVYTWIFGVESPMAQALPAGTTWEQLGMTATDGLKQVLEGIKQFQGMQG